MNIKTILGVSLSAKEYEKQVYNDYDRFMRAVERLGKRPMGIKSQYKVETAFLTKNAFSRPGKLRPKTLGGVVHWTGLTPTGTAPDIGFPKNYFEGLKNQKITKGKKPIYASANDIIGPKGEIVSVIPILEEAYHCGTLNLKPGMEVLVGSDPNKTLWGIETCPIDATSFSFATLQSLAWRCATLLIQFGHTDANLWRHYDIGNDEYLFNGQIWTGKPCPYPFVIDENAWLNFKNLVGRTIKYLE